MNKNTFWLIVVLAAVVAASLLWLLLAPRAPEVPVVQPPPKPASAVEELTEGTKASEIEKDLNTLLQEDKFLGDIDVELQQMEQQLEAEGL